MATEHWCPVHKLHGEWGPPHIQGHGHADVCHKQDAVGRICCKEAVAPEVVAAIRAEGRQEGNRKCIDALVLLEGLPDAETVLDDLGKRIRADERRMVTEAIARWLRDQMLDDLAENLLDGHWTIELP